MSLEGGEEEDLRALEGEDATDFREMSVVAGHDPHIAKVELEHGGVDAWSDAALAAFVCGEVGLVVPPGQTSGSVHDQGRVVEGRFPLSQHRQDDVNAESRGQIGDFAPYRAVLHRGQLSPGFFREAHDVEVLG